MAGAASKPSRSCALRPLTNGRRKPWPGRHGWIASDTDRQLASAAQRELIAWRMDVVLVSIEGEPHRKMRVRCDDGTPRWYAELLYRRSQKAKPSIRKYVLKDLAELCATGYIRPNAMTVEILDTLYTFNAPRDWGYYPSAAWGLQLQPNRAAVKYRKLRRARDSRGGNHATIESTPRVR